MARSERSSAVLEQRVLNVDDQNVIIYLDKIKKLLELGNKPKAIIEIEAIIIMLTKQVAKKKGKLVLPIVIPSPTETERANPIFLREFELANKINEVIHILNDRYVS